MIILSFEAVSIYLESEEKSTLFTGPEWPFNMVDFAFTELGQSLTVSSFEAEAIKSPNGLITTSLIAPLWPMNLYGLTWGLKFQTKTFPSSLPVIDCFLYLMLF